MSPISLSHSPSLPWPTPFTSDNLKDGQYHRDSEKERCNDSGLGSVIPKRCQEVGDIAFLCFISHGYILKKNFYLNEFNLFFMSMMHFCYN